MDLDFHVTQAFLGLLELCRDPKDVFECASSESRLAQAWLEKLCLLKCDNLAQRRLRNIYLSYLCACLNTGALKGPFLHNPPDELETDPNFEESGDAIFDCSLMPTRPECPDVKQSSNIKNCSKTPAKKSNKPSDGDNMNETVAACMYQTITNYPKCLNEYPFNALKTMPNQQKSSHSQSSLKPNSSQGQVKLQTKPSQAQLLLYDSSVLLKAIESELRYETEPGQNQYLEQELVRYKQYLMNHSAMARAAVQMAPTPMALRSFLIINFHNDLINLLSDESLKDW